MLKPLQDRVKKLQEDNNQWKPSSMKDVIPSSFDFLIETYFPWFRLKSLLKGICENFWTWRDGVRQGFLIEKAKNYLCCNIFSSLNICYPLDLFGGMLNFQPLRVLHWIESDATQDRSNLLFPSPTMLSWVITNFTGFSSSFVKVNLFTNNFGEGFEFHHKHIISLILKYTGKDAVAEVRATNVALTADGSKLTNNINGALMGLKETEAYKSMPLIGSRLLKFSKGRNIWFPSGKPLSCIAHRTKNVLGLYMQGWWCSEGKKFLILIPVLLYHE